MEFPILVLVVANVLDGSHVHDIPYDNFLGKVQFGLQLQIARQQAALGLEDHLHSLVRDWRALGMPLL